MFGIELKSPIQHDSGFRSSFKMGTYGEAAITRLCLKNFLTYGHVEYRPEPGLNMIIGPNGSGKSSLVCAICLALAGQTKLLGR